MKTLFIVLLGLASSLLPFKCANASNVKGAQQVVTEKINHHLYFDNDKDASEIKGSVTITFTVDSTGKINIIEEQSSDEHFKVFVHKKLAEIKFEEIYLLSGETFVMKIRSEE